MAFDLDALPAEALAFVEERMVATLTTRRPDGSLHVAPIAFTYDPDRRFIQMIADSGSHKVRNIEDGMTAVAVCQVDGYRWITFEGVARVRRERDAVAAAVAAFERRYRPASENPDRVAIEVAVTRAMGRF